MAENFKVPPVPSGSQMQQRPAAPAPRAQATMRPQGQAPVRQAPQAPAGAQVRRVPQPQQQAGASVRTAPTAPGMRPAGQQGQVRVQQAPRMAQPQTRPVATREEMPRATQRPAQNIYADNFAADLNLPPWVLTTKNMFIFVVIVLFVGMLFGSVLFGGSSSAPQQTSGLQGVVANRDITTRLPRCGRTDVGQACVLYIMNHTRYDKLAEEFFNEAVRLTEVQKYSISMVNPKYAKTRIPPGHFAEIKIPNIR